MPYIKFNLLVIFLSLWVWTSFAVCQQEAGFNNKTLNEMQNGRRILLELLSDPLWIERDAYDAGHVLMIPLHYAVYKNDKELLAAFRDHFQRMIKAYALGETDLRTIKELQYLSLASRYLALGAPLSSKELKQVLGKLLYDRFLYYWSESEAWQWGQNSFDGGVKERLLWKLSVTDVKRSFHNLVFDQELYLIGIAADLISSCWADKSGARACFESVDIFKEIMKQRLDTERKGWVFQAGYYYEHRTYQYAGYLSIPSEESKPFRIINIQQDSSHAHRWPLWLKQIEGACEVKEYKDRLRYQLLNVVIDYCQGIGVPVLKNYMSGHNGYYRWNYQTHKQGSGYGPYELSGTFGLGWWAFLGGGKVSELYESLAKAYPLNEAQLSLYEDLSQRKRHELIQESYQNGLRKTIAEMASEIAELEGQQIQNSVQ